MASGRWLYTRPGLKISPQTGYYRLPKKSDRQHEHGRGNCRSDLEGPPQVILAAIGNNGKKPGCWVVAQCAIIVGACLSALPPLYPLLLGEGRVRGNNIGELYRGRLEMFGVKRLFQCDFSPAAGHRKMPTALLVGRPLPCRHATTFLPRIPEDHRVQ